MICRCIVVYTHCVIQYLAAVEKQQNRVEPWDSDMELLLAMDLGLLAPQLMALVLHSNSFIYYFNQIRTFYKWIQYNFWRHATRKTLKVLIFIHLSTKDTALTYDGGGKLGPPLIGTFSPANPFVVSAILFQDWHRPQNVFRTCKRLPQQWPCVHWIYSQISFAKCKRSFFKKNKSYEHHILFLDGS